ncbi:MAG: hypothetical protein LC663_00385 [Actinobacteria bacterium]|nr:hypothetical protein [Actinomycetota bacterium]
MRKLVVVLSLAAAVGAALPSQAGGATVTAIGFTYLPAAADGSAGISMTAGSDLVFSNADLVSHTLTADDGTFDSGVVAKGTSHVFTDIPAGQYTYHCKIHLWMHGVLVVN